jgi:hypothetical protein
MRREIAVAAALVASVCFAQMPPNSFLVQPVTTVTALVAQVKTHPVVMDRYARHFQMTPDEVLTMLSGLHVETLKQDAYYEVLNVPAATGELRDKRILLKKGEKVFADKSGTPILCVKCGNPMVRTDVADAAQPAPMVSKPLGAADLEVPKGAAVVQPDLQVLQPAAPTAPDVTFQAPPTNPDVNTEIKGGAPFAGAVGLGLLPTLLIGVNSGSSPVPEPGTFLALGTGIALVALRLKRRAR